MLITVHEHSTINIGKERQHHENNDKKQISYNDRDFLLTLVFEDKHQNKLQKKYSPKKKIFEWCSNQTIKTTSIVGTIKIDDELTIEILPKIFNSDTKSSIETSRKNLIRLVEIAEYDDLLDNENEIEEDAENIPYLEFIILRYTTKLLKKLQKGIYSEYITKVEESSFVRGAIQPHLQDVFDKSKITCKFQELSFNNKLMRTFKTVAEHLLKNSMFSYEIKQNLFEITSILQNVESYHKLEIFNFENLCFNRLNESYEILFYQSKIIYFEYFPLNSEEEEITPYWAIYFDMDFLFEKFIGYLLEKSGFKINEQENIYPYKNKFVTPDFILYDHQIVIDAKYSKYPIRSENIFQITNYMDNLDFEGTLIKVGDISENTHYINNMKGKSFNVISLDMGADFDNIIENFRFTTDTNNKLDYIFDENIFYEEMSEKLEQNLPTDYTNLVKLSETYKEEKNWKKAIECHYKLLEQSQNNHWKSFNLNRIGTYLYKLEKFSEAETNFLTSIKEEENSYAYSFLGKIEFYENKDFDKAINYYSKAIQYSIDNNDFKSYYYRERGYAHRSNSEYPSAITDFKTAVELNSNLSNKLLSEIERLEYER